MKKQIISAVVLFVFLVGLVAFLSHQSGESPTSVVIAVPGNDMVENFNTNYYTKWLEEKTGYDIRFEYIPAGYEKEYIHTMLTSKSGEVDGVFLSGNEDYFSVDELNEYGKAGLLANLSEYIPDDSNFWRLMGDYGLREKIERDGTVYYYPNMDTARKSRNLQVLWLNSDWLKSLGMAIPRTSGELKKVLTAFRDKDPNGNGKRDELPLVSCGENIPLRSYYYLLNSFTYYDPVHGGLYKNGNGDLICSMEKDSFREGLIYCNSLYREGLLAGDCFSYTSKQMMELVNSPEDLVGAFTCRSIADVIYPNFPDILAKFIYIPPLEGEDGKKNAVWVDYGRRVGGYVPAGSSHKKEVCEIMDTMLSEEGALISEFGEKGVDWKDSEKSDLSIYGNRAYITTINYLGDRIQNKNFAGIGPQILKDDYANGVTWNGDNSLFEYHDVHAVNLYEKYYLPKEQRMWEPDDGDEDYRALRAYADARICDLITGKADVKDNGTWEGFLREIRKKTEKIKKKMAGGS